MAELSLLGALGCGKWLVQTLIEELEWEGSYDYIVLQVISNELCMRGQGLFVCVWEEEEEEGGVPFYFC